MAVDKLHELVTPVVIIDSNGVESDQLESANDKLARMLGENGGVHETGTTAVTGNFAAIQCLEATVFSLLTRENFTGDALTGVTFAAGTIIYGPTTAFTLTSGKVIAYNR